MNSLMVRLPHYGRRAAVAPLYGVDEMKVVDSSTASAIELLSSVAHDDSGQPVDAMKLTAGERDRLLGRLWQQTFGDRVDSTVRCAECEERFDVDFLLSDLLASVFGEAAQDSGERVVVDGCTARLPVGEDELAVAGLSRARAAAELARRCVVEGRCEDPAMLVEALSEREPVVDLSLAAACVECDAQQSIRFDLQQFVLSALVNEREHLLYELHALARSYGWGLTEILELSRQDRKSLVRFVVGDANGGRR